MTAIGSMLSQGDDGVFKDLVSSSIPVTPAKLVNGRLGIAVDMVVDCNSEVFDLNDRYVQ